KDKEYITQEGLYSITLDIPEKAEAVLSDWKTLEAKKKEEYPELIIPVETKDVAG
ncbi:hypothetical protein KI387_012012, partial [Taxus chinensis]